MQILVDKDGYIVSYAIVGDLVDGIEVDDPSDMDLFEETFEGYKYENGELTYDGEHYNEIISRRNIPPESIAESITNIQLALAEVYELIEGGLS